MLRMDGKMLLTKDETISELKNEKSCSDHILYEANGCGFHAAKLLSIEPYFVEAKETNDVGFTKSCMKGFFRLKFQESDDVKTYETDVNPEVANKVYYYITKDGRITHLFPNKEDITAYATQAFAEFNKSNDSEDNSMLLFMAFPLMLLPLSVMLYSIPLFFKLALSLTWMASFIAFFFSSPSKQNNNQKYKDKEAKLQSFIKQVKNFEE